MDKELTDKMNKLSHEYCDLEDGSCDKVKGHNGFQAGFRAAVELMKVKVKEAKEECDHDWIAEHGWNDAICERCGVWAKDLDKDDDATTKTLETKTDE